MTHVEARRHMSGIEFFRRMLAGEMPPPPMIDLLGIRLAEVDAGRVVFTATCEERFYNGTGVAHGGFAATLLDTALGCAINSAMPAGRRFTTLRNEGNQNNVLDYVRHHWGSCCVFADGHAEWIAHPRTVTEQMWWVNKSYVPPPI